MNKQRDVLKVSDGRTRPANLHGRRTPHARAYYTVEDLCSRYGLFSCPNSLGRAA